MSTYRINGIDYDFERHHISASANDRVPASWRYLIKPPDDCIGGLDVDSPIDVAYIARAKAEGFIEVSPDIYDEFLRSRMFKAAFAGKFSEHMQERYNIQRARVALCEIDQAHFTWGEWAEFQPDALGYDGIDKDGYLQLLNIKPDDQTKDTSRGKQIQSPQAGTIQTRAANLSRTA